MYRHGAVRQRGLSQHLGQQRLPHSVAAVVGEGRGPGLSQAEEFGGLLALEPSGAGGELENRQPGQGRGRPPDLPESRHAVHRRDQVGHGADGPEAPGGGGRGGPVDPLLPRLSGLAKVAVEIEKARGHHRALPVQRDRPGRKGKPGAHLDQEPILQQEVAVQQVQSREGVDQAHLPEQDPGHAGCRSPERSSTPSWRSHSESWTSTRSLSEVGRL